MAIYGTALLSVCLLVGLAIGKLLGIVLSVQANVGGVGIAMLLLIVFCDQFRRYDLLPQPTASGIVFWSSIYIPIVVAMAASQNVVAAVRGGPAAITAGVVTVIISFAMVPLIARLGKEESILTEDSENSAP